LDELVKNTGLYKSQISVAIKQLKSKHPEWINEHEEKKLGKGRPSKIYSFKIGYDKIVALLEEEQEKNIQ
jgi:predicted transcriptional regulator